MSDIFSALLNATISTIETGGSRIVQVSGAVPLVIHLPTGSTIDGVAATVSDAEVTGSLLTGLSAGSSYAAPAATDSILQAMNKLAYDVGNAAIIAKVLTGYTAGAGTVAASDSILSAIQKIDGNTSNAAVIGRVLTGWTSGAGTVAQTDSILQAFQKIDGNVGTKLSSNGFSDSAVTAKLLTGLAAGTNTPIAATDSILVALANLQAQIDAL
jgi:trimeric autotransporter adhesin